MPQSWCCVISPTVVDDVSQGEMPESSWRSQNSCQLLINLLILFFLCLVLYCYFPQCPKDLVYSLCYLSWFWFCQLLFVSIWKDVLPVWTLLCLSLLFCSLSWKFCHLAGSHATTLNFYFPCGLHYSIIQNVCTFCDCAITVLKNLNISLVVVPFYYAYCSLKHSF